MTDMDCKAEEGYKCFQYMCFPWNRSFDHLISHGGDVEEYVKGNSSGSSDICNGVF